MSYRLIRHCWMIAALTAPLVAAVSAPLEKPAEVTSKAADLAKAAMDAFKAGHQREAITLAGPLADQGNAEALYLMGFVYETGKGINQDQAKAMEFYRKAIAAKNGDAVYRLAFLLLASEKSEEREQARGLLETAVKTDPTVAARILGEAYLRGRLTAAADPTKAIFWWQHAADAGDTPSMLLLARFYEGNFGFPAMKNLPLSLANYAKAGGLGNAGAMAALGSRYLSGEAAIRDEPKGREWLKKAIEAKELSAYLALGDFEENIKKNPAAALAEYERGAAAGQPGCILRAADFYIEGKAVAKDIERGFDLLTKAAAAGNTVADLRLAVHSLSGDKPDLLGGYNHLLKAANGNLVEAQNELGLLYLSGKLAIADPAAGVVWLTRAAQGGYAQAQNNLATLYERGAGVSQNLATACQLYTAAANQGHGPATFALARISREGGGSQPNPATAWALAKLAAERGATEGTALATEIETQLDKKQLADAKAKLAELKAGASSPQAETTSNQTIEKQPKTEKSNKK